MHRALAAFLVLTLSAACSEPPQKEIDRAQGAIDAARAAGAEQFAAEPFKAATAAMQQAHEAVQQRDYRLALSRAVDANERALEAARQAAAGAARARADAEGAITRLQGLLTSLDERLEAPAAARIPAKELEPARTARAAADDALQKARAAHAQGNYLGWVEDTRGVIAKTNEQIRALAELTEARAGRGQRRRR